MIRQKSYSSNVYTLLDASKVDIEPLNEEKRYEKEVEEVKVEAKKPAPKKGVEDTQIVCISSSPKKVEEVEEEDNRPMHERELERVAKETEEALEKLFRENNCMDYEEFVEGLEEEVEDSMKSGIVN